MQKTWQTKALVFGACSALVSRGSGVRRPWALGLCTWVLPLAAVCLPLKRKKRITYFWLCWVFVAASRLPLSCCKWGLLSDYGAVASR